VCRRLNSNVRVLLANTGNHLTLSFTFHDDGSLHDDLSLSIGGATFRCDSYYFNLDDDGREDQSDHEKVKHALERLLHQWLTVARKLRDSDTVFLPYDFSDQYTGWLRVVRHGDTVDIVRGTSNIEGWSFYPSEVGELLYELRDFAPDGRCVSMRAADLVVSIESSIAALK